MTLFNLKIMKLHKELSQDKWNRFDKKNQILMIGSELGRVKTWICRKDYEEARESYLRAIEIIDLTINDPKWKDCLRELLRYKELIAEAYLLKYRDLSICLNLYKTLLSWNGETERLII